MISPLASVSSMDSPSTRTGSKTRERITSAATTATRIVSTQLRISCPTVFFSFFFPFFVLFSTAAVSTA